MINLIPSDAKDALKQEYLVRVMSVWLTLWGSALLLVLAMFLPVFVYISFQKDVLSELIEGESYLVDEQNVSAELLLRANRQAQLLLQTTSVYTLHETIAPYIQDLARPNIELTGIDLNQSSQPTVIVDGIAIDRFALANFRDGLEKNDLFETVTLPISSLVRDSEIPFRITINIATTTPGL